MTVPPPRPINTFDGIQEPPEISLDSHEASFLSSLATRHDYGVFSDLGYDLVTPLRASSLLPIALFNDSQLVALGIDLHRYGVLISRDVLDVIGVVSCTSFAPGSRKSLPQCLGFFGR